MGNIENPSYMPELQMPFVEPLTFAQRLGNTINYALQVRENDHHVFNEAFELHVKENHWCVCNNSLTQDYDCLGRFWWPIFFNIDGVLDLG